LREVKQVGWREHGGNLGETAAVEKRNGFGSRFCGGGGIARTEGPQVQVLPR
jgi:hypothetical protein